MRPEPAIGDEAAAAAIAPESEDRPAVERRHRAEWRTQARLLDQAIAAGDGEAARFAKLAAEVLKIRQEGERRAWRLDKPADAKDADGKDGEAHDEPLTRIEWVIVDPPRRDD